MKIQLRFFAGVREALGVSQEELVIPDTVDTVGKVQAFLLERGDVWAATLAEGRSLRMAFDQQMCDADTPIRDGGEVAFFPPVTGG